MKQLLVFAAILLFGNFHLRGQNQLEDILAQLPAKSSAQLELLMEQLAGQGTPAVLELAGNLVPPRILTEDVKERYALSGLAKYLGKTGATKYRDQIEDAFLQALDLDLDIEVEVFLIEQLQFFGTSKSVAKLESKINLVCEPVVQTLTQIGTPEALAVLIQASKSSQGYCLQVIAKAIAKTPSAEVIERLSSILGNQPDEPLKLIVLSGLARSGSNAAFQPLFSHAQTNPQEGNDLLLVLVANQVSSGNLANLEATVEQILSTGNEEQKEQAIMLAARYLNASSKKMLVQTLRKGPVGRANQVTTVLAEESTIPLAPYFKVIKKVDNQTKIGLLYAAASRDYRPALSVARSYLKTDDPPLQIAAVQTVSQLAGKASLGDLQKVLVEARDPQVLKIAAQEFSRWITNENFDFLTVALQKSSGNNKTNLIDLIADRQIASFWPQVEPFLEDQNERVRASAFAAIPRLTGNASVNDLIALVSIAENDVEMAAIEQAFQIKANHSEDKNEIVEPLIDAFGSSNPKLLGRVFPAIGGEKALNFIVNSSDQSSLLDWKTPSAIPHIFSFLNGEKHDQAFASILRLTSHPEVPADLRVLYLRKLMAAARDTDQMKRVIGSLADTKSHTAFIFVKNLLAQEDLKVSAANALVRLALPPTGESTGLIGAEIREGLLRADTILASTEDAYTQAFLHNYLIAMPDEAGFVSMFNGKDLQGWQGLVGNPITRDTMFRPVLRLQQQEADSNLVHNWKVEDGVITFFGDGYQNLCSVNSYRDFELLVDWKISKGGDSGIYLRGSPQIQIWDTSMVAEGAQVGSGGLYNNQVYENKPLQVADRPAGEWNTFRIIMIQDKVTVYLNGTLVTDNVTLENYWNRELPIFREGPIELQAHGTNLQFRDIYVREIKSAPELPEFEKNMGFVQLFNGVNLEGWVGNKIDYVVENGEIIIYPGDAGGTGNLYTEKEYDNFTFSFEFKLTPGANNGLGIHAPLEGDAAYLGKEIQILDNDAEMYAGLKDYQYHGSVYGLVAAEKGALKPVGEWNSEEVTVKGNQIRVILNGKRIVNTDLDIATRAGTLDGKDHPGLKKLKGHIGFLGHGSEVHFRNIRIREDKE